MSEKSYHCLYHHSYCFFVQKVGKNNLSEYETSVPLCIYGLWMRGDVFSDQVGSVVAVLAWTGEMWALKEELRCFFKFLKVERILDQYLISGVLPLNIWWIMSLYICLYLCVCVEKTLCGVCMSLSYLVWFHCIRLLFWIYPGDFYMSLPRATFSIFPKCWLALMLRLPCIPESCERSLWMENVNLVGRVALF